MSRKDTWILVLCAALSLSHPGFAGTTGQLAGWIVDEQGDSLPGVSISASSSSQIGGLQPAETDINGWFLYPRLAPGYYTVLIELDGFVTQELTEVQVRLDGRTELRVTLPVASFGEQIVITETTPVVDPEQVSTGQTFTEEYLREATVGMENRHYLGLLPQTAGVEGGGRFGVAVLGSTLLDNTYLIDGSDTTDPYDKMMGFITLSFEAIDEIAFHTAGFGAEYGRATGGVVNLITKSGGNRFSGSFDYRYGDSGFSSGGDHHDPDEEPFDTWDLNASLGGPILRDGLWFFTSLQTFSEDFTPTGAPTTQRWNEQNYLGKLTWQAAPSWLLTGRVIGNPLDVERWTASQFRAPEADSDWEWRSLNAHLELSGVLSENLLLGVRIGAQDSSNDYFPTSRDLTTIGHFNYDNGEDYGNYWGQSYDERERQEIDTDLTWFVEGFAGYHEVKGGMRHGTTGYRSDYCYLGSGQPCAIGDDGYFFQDMIDGAGDPTPYEMLVQEAAGPQDFEGSLQSLYLQDSWRILPDLTFKLGLRWDGSRMDNDVGQEIANLALIQPRLGLAWDLRNNGRNIVRASWGRYMHPSRLSIAEYVAEKSTPLESWASCSLVGLTDPALCARVAELDGIDHRLDPEGWDPAGWWLYDVYFSAMSRTSKDLEPMFADELVLAYERELLHLTSLELSYVEKETKNIIEDTCNGSFPSPQPDPECDYAIVANLPGLVKDYKALMLRLESRASGRFHVIGSYVYSESKGNSRGGGETSPDFDVWPYHFANRYGYLPDQSRHRVKLNGFVILPLDFSLAINSWWSSEFRWTPQTRSGVPWGTMFLEPRGNRSEPGIFQLDLQVGKSFTWKRTRLKLFGTVYNALDAESATWVCENDTGCGEFAMGDPIEWQQPRRYELGLRVEF